MAPQLGANMCTKENPAPGCHSPKHMSLSDSESTCGGTPSGTSSNCSSHGTPEGVIRKPDEECWYANPEPALRPSSGLEDERAFSSLFSPPKPAQPKTPLRLPQSERAFSSLFSVPNPAQPKTSLKLSPNAKLFVPMATPIKGISSKEVGSARPSLPPPPPPVAAPTIVESFAHSEPPPPPPTTAEFPPPPGLQKPLRKHAVPFVPRSAAANCSQR